MSTLASCRQWYSITPAEKKELERIAKEHGITPGNYVRKRAFSRLRSNADTLAIRQLNKAGHNLNQLLRKVHSGSIESDEIRSAIIEIRAAVAGLNKVEENKVEDE